jgi:hypothetical protein
VPLPAPPLEVVLDPPVPLLEELLEVAPLLEELELLVFDPPVPLDELELLAPLDELELLAPPSDPPVPLDELEELAPPSDPPVPLDELEELAPPSDPPVPLDELEELVPPSLPDEQVPLAQVPPMHAVPSGSLDQAVVEVAGVHTWQSLAGLTVSAG